ncbi:hypothetical protein JVU11DRAFT_8781 [Chiua virens]|nr:hypothetical protein JVU11DRAFT_8781 [Chiua virens]
MTQIPMYRSEAAHGNVLLGSMMTMTTLTLCQIMFDFPYDKQNSSTYGITDLWGSSTLSSLTFGLTLT